LSFSFILSLSNACLSAFPRNVFLDTEQVGEEMH
jgi:hypothetical protein